MTTNINYYIIAGLGNPGNEYNKTRHNVGFDVIDAISDKYNIPLDKKKFNALMGTGTIDGKKVCLLKPQTFMNLSGKSVLAAKTFYKALTDNIYVIHDELDLEIGKIRTKIGGGAAGHNGLKDIDKSVGKNYHRLRIGIKNNNDKIESKNFVLGKFTKDEQIIIEKIVDFTADNIESLLFDEDKSRFVNKYHVVCS